MISEHNAAISIGLDALAKGKTVAPVEVPRFPHDLHADFMSKKRRGKKVR